MKTICFSFKSADNKTDIYAKKWIPENEVKAVLQITHGMLEHIERYNDFASYIADNNILVTGQDLLGHGCSVKSSEQRGFFATRNGNEILLNDITTLMKITKAEFPKIPYFHLGHSMGSYLIRQFITEHSKDISGAILVGSGYPSRVLISFGEALSKLIGSFRGQNYRSEFLDKISIGSFNKHYKNPKTAVDWLSRDQKVVEDYVNDEKIDFIFSTNAYMNMYKSIKHIHKSREIRKVSKELPIIFLSGSEDPVGDMGEGVRKSYQKLADQGFMDVAIKLYDGARHEIINETNKKEVYQDICNWIDERIDYIE